MRVFFCIAILFLIACSKENKQALPNPTQTSIINGFDLSFTPLLEENNTLFYIDSLPLPILDVAQKKGINTIRLRLWHSPASKHSQLNEVIAFAKRIKSKGLKFWLDFHYSDTWADPGAQSKPKAWDNLPLSILNDSLYAYTKSVLSLLKAQGLAPEYIQIGNEINNGFLWPTGQINDLTDTNFVHFASLLKSGIKACREILPQTQLMIHYAGYANARAYFQALIQKDVSFDIIGISYYPWWHGNKLQDLSVSLSYLSTLYKPIVIAETAYPFTLQWNDWTTNILGNAYNLVSNMPATPNGQALFLANLRNIVSQNQSINQHYGICYWAPEWIAYKGANATDASPWENLTLFDFNNKTLPAMDSLIIK